MLLTMARISTTLRSYAIIAVVYPISFLILEVYQCGKIQFEKGTTCKGIRITGPINCVSPSC